MLIPFKVKRLGLVSNSFIVDDYTADQIIAGAGAYKPLKEVIGNAKEQTGYRCVEFNLPF